MANKNTFRSVAGKLLPQSDTINAAGAPAYALRRQARARAVRRDGLLQLHLTTLRQRRR